VCAKKSLLRDDEVDDERTGKELVIDKYNTRLLKNMESFYFSN
jgi:hypothetical protein